MSTATTQNAGANSAGGDQQHPKPDQPHMPAPQFVYPPPGSYPQYFYAPAPEGAEGVPPGQPVMMALPPLPPGMVYAFPPPPGHGGPGMPPFAQVVPTLRPKRRQVKMACTNCAAACKRCDEARPCERCVKYGVPDQCKDGQRKERKKGIKRGPYKRKNKDEQEQQAQPSIAEQGWVAPPFAMPPPPEGYAHMPPHFMFAPPPGPDGQPQHPPMMPYFFPQPYPGYPPMMPHSQPASAKDHDGGEEPAKKKAKVVSGGTGTMGAGESNRERRTREREKRKEGRRSSRPEATDGALAVEHAEDGREDEESN